MSVVDRVFHRCRHVDKVSMPADFASDNVLESRPGSVRDMKIAFDFLRRHINWVRATSTYSKPVEGRSPHAVGWLAGWLAD